MYLWPADFLVALETSDGIDGRRASQDIAFIMG